MKRILIALGLSAALLCGQASARNLPELTINGTASGAVVLAEEGTTYVSLRTAARELDGEAQVSWEAGQAVVRTSALTLTAEPGQGWLTANGRCLYIPGDVQAREGRVLVPIRVLAEAFGAEVHWDGERRLITVETTGEIPQADYDAGGVYWLARIISAESCGESLEGQIAVGNVVLNRVKSGEFPDTIYGVIFDERWGGQFEPVRNGTIYDSPTRQSIAAAKLCLEGISVAGDSLYFLDPRKAGNLWTVYHRPYRMTIGNHDFYA